MGMGVEILVDMAGCFARSLASGHTVEPSNWGFGYPRAELPA